MFTIKARTHGDHLHVYEAASYWRAPDDSLTFTDTAGDDITLYVGPKARKDIAVLNSAGVRVEFMEAAAIPDVASAA